MDIRDMQCEIMSEMAMIYEYGIGTEREIKL